MGHSPDTSVVNPDGEAWDVKELFVVDGSILPTSLGVNPQLSVMSIGMPAPSDVVASTVDHGAKT